MWSLSDSIWMVTGTSSSMLGLICVMVDCCCCWMARVCSVLMFCVCCVSCSMFRTGADGVSFRLSLFMGSFCTIHSTDPRPLLGVCIKPFGELEVTIVIGLCCGESDTRLMTSTVSELFHLSRSVLTMEEYRCCLRLPCSSFDWASAACFDLASNCETFVLFVGCCAFLLGLPALPFLCFCFCFVVVSFLVGLVAACCVCLLVPSWGSSCCCVDCSASHFSFCFFSSKQNFLIFSLFYLYSPTVLHATKSISLGLFGIVSVAMAMSLFLISVSFIFGVSIVIVWVV